MKAANIQRLFKSGKPGIDFVRFNFLHLEYEDNGTPPPCQGGVRLCSVIFADCCNLILFCAMVTKYFIEYIGPRCREKIHTFELPASCTFMFLLPLALSLLMNKHATHNAVDYYRLIAGPWQCQGHKAYFQRRKKLPWFVKKSSAATPFSWLFIFVGHSYLSFLEMSIWTSSMVPL